MERWIHPASIVHHLQPVPYNLPMAQPDYGMKTARRKKRFPWLAFLLLLGSIYVFWILPRQLPDRPVKVEFVPAGRT